MSSSTQQQFKAKQDKVTQEVRSLLENRQREQAVAYYQKVCCCSRARAELFVSDLEKERREAFRDKLMEKIRRR